VARGWDSKSVEEQIHAADARRGIPRTKLTPEQIEMERKRESLELQRTRVLREIANSTSERHRQTLENGLKYLEEQLAELGAKSPGKREMGA
jgi:hypothetical protein